jgi:hypothetical protein
MFKRIIWWSTGAVMGAGGSWWAKRKVKRVVAEKLDDVKIAIHPATIATNTRDRVERAVQAGKWAAEDRELELKHQLELARTGKSKPS